MKKYVLIILFIYLSIFIFSDYLIIMRKNAQLPEDFIPFHFYDNYLIGKSIFNIQDDNTVFSTYLDFSKPVYLIKFQNNIQDIKGDIIFTDFENSTVLVYGDVFNQYNRDIEITRLFFDNPLKTPLRIYPKFPLVKMDYTFLDSISSYINGDSIWNYIGLLSGYYNYSPTYTITTRFVDQPGCDSAAVYLFNKLTSYALDSVYYHTFSGTFSSWFGGGTFSTKNVVGFKKGTNSNGECIVIGAHYDDISYPADDHTTIAPGADDNASGSSGVLEIARLLKDIETERDIYFVLFSGEEEGLYGSYYFVYDKIVPSGKFVFSMLNMDMIGHTTTSNAMRIYGVEASAPLYGLCKDIADNITYLTSYLTGPSSGSDHYYFEQAGYKALFTIEDEFSPVYHSTQDSITYLTKDFMREIVRSVYATAFVTSNMPSSVNNITLTDNGDSSITINWDKVNNTDIKGYKIYYNNNVISVPDTNNYILYSLYPDTLYTVYITAVDSSNWESFKENFDTITPSFIPHKTTITKINSDNNYVYLYYNKALSTDIKDYTVYRRTLTDTFIAITTLTDTFFIDSTISGNDIYEYAVKVNDIDGYSSDYSNIVQIRLITLTKDMIVIDETFNSSQYPDSAVDSFYQYIFANYNCDIYDADNDSMIDIVDFGEYSILVFIDDDLSENKLNLEHIANYINNGGKALLMGWDIGSIICNYPELFPFVTDSNSIAKQIFYINEFNRNQNADLDFVIYNNDTISFDANKLSFMLGGKITYAGIFDIDTTNASSLALYHSYSGDTVFNGKNTIFKNNVSTFIIANIPLYPIETNDAVNIIDSMLSCFGCYSGINNNPYNKIQHNVFFNKLIANTLKMDINGFRNEFLSIKLYNVNGQYIKTLYNNIISDNNKTIEFNINIPQGIYFLRFQSNSLNKNEKIIIIK